MKKLLIITLLNFVFTIDYNTEIQPVFDSNCINCHSYGSNSHNEHQLILTSYFSLMSGGVSGDVVLAGDTVKVGDAAAAATLTSNGAGTLTVTTGGTTDLILNTNGGTNAGDITFD